MKKQKPSK